MMGLTGKFSLLLSTCVILAVVTTTVVTSRFYTIDQETNLIQAQTQQSLEIEKAISEKFSVLHAQVKAVLLSEETPLVKLLESLPEIEGAELWNESKQIGAEPVAVTNTPPPLGVSDWAIFSPKTFPRSIVSKAAWVGRFGEKSVVLYLKSPWFEDSLSNFRGISGQIISMSGEVIASNLPPEKMASVTTQSSLSLNKGTPSSQKILAISGDELLSTSLVTMEDPPVLIFLNTPTQMIQRVIYRTYRYTAFITVGMLLLTIIAGILFSASLTRPLRVLEAQTREIAQGRFDLPTVKNAARSDEVGGLSRAFSRMGQDLKKLREELRHTERLAALGKFSASIAHEIKNPLGAIIINTHLAEEQLNTSPLDAEAIKTTLGYVKEETWRADRIVKSLMKFARNEKPPMREFNLTDRVRRSLAILQASVQQAGVTLLCQVQESPLYIEGNEDNIHEVLINLIQNAIYAMKECPTKTLKITLNESQQEVVLEIEDSGTGIPDNVKNNLFEPFFTTKPMGEGTGLGLSVCHGIIRNHGGKIEVFSEVGRGTRFVLTFPAPVSSHIAA